MDVLLKEMREIDAAQNYSIQTAPPIGEQLRGNLWANDFPQNSVDKSFAEFWAQSLNPSTSQAASNRPDTLKARNFFENAPMTNVSLFSTLIICYTINCY